MLIVSHLGLKTVVRPAGPDDHLAGTYFLEIQRNF